MDTANFFWPPISERAPGVGPTIVPIAPGVATSTLERSIADNLDAASNRLMDAQGGAPASHSHQARDTRVAKRAPEDGADFAEPCHTVPRYPISGGFTRRGLMSSQQVSPQDHTPFLRANAQSAAFGELLEMLRPVKGCPNRRYRDNSEIGDELQQRIVCLKINQRTSVEDVVRAHRIPSLLVDGERYFPGSVEATFYDIGYDAARRAGIDASSLEAEEIEHIGRLTVEDILMNPSDRRDGFNGFSPYFKPLQFHAHANGLQDAADMLDRITSDASYGYPMTGLYRAAKLLADDGKLLAKHLRSCEPKTPRPTLAYHVLG
ncbi:hypothetical protein PPN31114_02355 [Pandoraea pneumonica]|uniref:Uncharacterized protein n=1 Tax=Pandoraea pneumonica TaxID=2508299 RepID=A0A5E4V1M9_9BURK|nr:hypothetical protein [Pandoraea pneumonica]VVE05484.1 hypothetical protein PPN31114_02355 [Pandoraea pneumonica]